MAYPNLWYGTEADVFIQQKATAGSEVALNYTAQRYSAQITEISLSGGDRDVEEIKSLGNNQIFRENPQEVLEVEIVTLKKSAELAQYVFGNTAFDTTDPITTIGDSARLRCRIIVQYPAGLIGEPASGAAQRLIFNDCYAVTIERSTDAEGYLEETISFKCIAANFKEQSTADAAVNPLTALPTY